ncbi:MAG TPA: MFS transporter [Solibacterales bacterium]|nr:MFS transporter [Bryobacterales bacterium]
MTRVRWWMLTLLFFATTINYLDRIVFSVLNSVISREMHIDDKMYGYINASFQATYTIGFLAMGKFIDKFGTRIGYAVSITWWSIAAGLHALAQTPMQLGLWRGLLGFGESGNFPAAIKSVAEWFPKKDRAFATGIFNAGTNVASMIGPPVFVWMTLHVGWRSCFLITASTGFVWLVFWLLSYQHPSRHKGVNQQELAYIHSGEEPAKSDVKVGWGEALTYRQTWGFALAKFFSDPVWWFYLIWLPRYLFDVRKFKLEEIGWALPVVYLMADFGSVGGGWISGYFIRRGMPNGRARKIAMALCVACMPVAALAVLAESPVLAIALVCFATAGHQGWSANLYTTTSDVFPKPAVASVTGIGGFLGGLGGILFSAVLPGHIVSNFGYTPIFLIMGTFHLIAYFCVLRLIGDMKPLELKHAHHSD